MKKTTSIQVGMLPSTAPMATLALYLHNTLKFSDKKRQLLAQEQGIFVCFKMLLSVEINKTLSPFYNIIIKSANVDKGGGVKRLSTKCG